MSRCARRVVGQLPPLIEFARLGSCGNACLRAAVSTLKDARTLKLVNAAESSTARRKRIKNLCKEFGIGSRTALTLESAGRATRRGALIVGQESKAVSLPINRDCHRTPRL